MNPHKTTFRKRLPGRKGMEGRSENCLRLFAKPQDVKRAYEGSGIGSINKCPAKANALQQKIKHWAEMALLINNEFVQQPEGFGFVVKESALVCGFVEGFDTDMGDDLTQTWAMI